MGRLLEEDLSRVRCCNGRPHRGGPELRTGLFAIAVVALFACSNSAPLSAGLAGSWIGTAVARFGSGGSVTYDATIVVTVASDTVSVAGICPDGTGLMALTGSGTSASSSGTLTCPGIALAGCEAVVFSYAKADVLLDGATSLVFAATGSASGCGDTETLVTSFFGSPPLDAGPPLPPWDLRFKPVGESLVPLGGFGGGVDPGFGEGIATNSGPGLIDWGLVSGGGFFLNYLYSAAQPVVYLDTLWFDGSTCPATLSAALAGNNVITALDGDPYLANGSCILLGVAQPDGGPTFQYLSEDAVPAAHILEALSGSPSAASYVVTAIFQADAGLYTYIAESVGQLPDGGYEAFDTLIQTPLVEDVASGAEALADAGYIITASTWLGEPYYTLVGTRPSGSTVAHATMTMTTDVEHYFGDAQAMLLDGYVPVSVMADYSVLPDGGVIGETLLIGER